MQNASRTQNASVAERLDCKKCGWPLVKEGNLKCSRCGQETPAALALGKEDFRCPHCLEQGCRKAKCLAKANQIKCPNCGTLNSLKEDGMTTEKVSQILNLIKGLTKEEKSELSRRMNGLDEESIKSVSGPELEEKMVEFLKKVAYSKVKWEKEAASSGRGPTRWVHYITTIDGIKVSLCAEPIKYRRIEIIFKENDKSYSFDTREIEKGEKRFAGKREKEIYKIYATLLFSAYKQTDIPEREKEEKLEMAANGEMLEKISAASNKL